MQSGVPVRVSREDFKKDELLQVAALRFSRLGRSGLYSTVKVSCSRQ